MILIVGLGNPGEKYKNNRHNVGHQLINYLIKKLLITDYKLKLIKTDCYMNESGTFIKKLIRNQKSEINKLIIVHDDLDIPLGKFHIQFASGPQHHNGLKSIEENLKSKDFWRLRIGVDNRVPERWTNGNKYVLNDFLSDEKNKLEKEVFPKIFSQLKLFLKNKFSLYL